MKDYKYEKGLKLAGGVIISCLFLMISGTSVYAMGTGFRNLYEKVYEKTVVEEEAEIVITEFIEEPYREEEAKIITGEGIILYSGSMIIEWDIPAKTLVAAESAISLEKGDTVTVSAFTEPEDKSVIVGLITPYKTKLYVNGKGVAGGTLEIKVAGDYIVFIENTDDIAFTVNGSVVCQ